MMTWKITFGCIATLAELQGGNLVWVLSVISLNTPEIFGEIPERFEYVQFFGKNLFHKKSKKIVKPFTSIEVYIFNLLFIYQKKVTDFW